VTNYKQSANEKPSKATEQKPIDVQETSSLAVASAPHPLVGTCLMAYSNADAKSFA
jgi:hypothetical protein